MRPNAALRGFAMPMAAAFAAVMSASSRAEDSMTDGPEQETARVQIVIQSRNASAVLALLMERLRVLSVSPEFRSALKIEERSPALDACARTARRDPSGRVFDLAQCAGAWPPSEKSNYEKAFERSYANAVHRSGAYSFPAVTVTTFESELRLQAEQFPKAVVDEPFRPRKREAFEPTDEFRKILCNPRITFVDADTCNKNLRVVSRLGVYQPDIYVTQTGYRVDINKPIPLEMATNLRRAILHNLNVPDKTPSALRVAVLKWEKAGTEQAGPPSDSQGTENGADIAALWAALGVGADAIDLGRHGDETPPTLLIFDSPEIVTPISIVDWFAQLKFSASVQDGCSTDSAHSDAVAGLFFPNALIQKLRGEASVGRLVASDWAGYILGAQHFSGAAVVNDAPWFRRNVFGNAGDPIVALTVFSKRYEGPDEGTATNAADSYLADPSNLLVVATAQWSSVSGVSKFRPDATQPTQNAGDLEELCNNKAWPACLGRHHRVVVVGPAQYPDNDKGATVLQPTDYVMGASTVRMLAPGGNVPVLAKCAAHATGAERTWKVAKSSGSSYAAPLVALVTLKLLQIGPPRMRRELPEAAFWRILATTSPLDIQQGQETNTLSQFGRLDAGKALLGATPQETGPDNAAILYEDDGQEAEVAAPAVVVPYPWMDQPLLVDAPVGVKPQMQLLGRGVITLTSMKGDVAGDKEAIEFDRILRIVRRPVQDLPGTPLFDVYYISGVKPKFVTVKRRVRLGRQDFIEQPGYCRSDGQPLPADGTGKPKGQAQPACLYAKRSAAIAFEALDLNKVRDVVFPLLHYGSKPPAGIVPTDVQAMVAKGSPWRDEVCRTGPRVGAQKVLAGYTAAKLEAWCAP